MNAYRPSMREPGRHGGPAITVWAFGDAPREYQLASSAGGGEMWVAHVPAALVEADGAAPLWLDRLDAGLLPEKIDLDDGALIVIGGR